MPTKGHQSSHADGSDEEDSQTTRPGQECGCHQRHGGKAQVNGGQERLSAVEQLARASGVSGNLWTIRGRDTCSSCAGWSDH